MRLLIWMCTECTLTRLIQKYKQINQEIRMEKSIRRQTALRAAGIIFLIKVLWLFVFFYSFSSARWAGHIYADIWPWRDFLLNCAKGELPYIDFSREYPLFTGYFYWLLQPFLPTANSDIFLRNYAVISMFIDVLVAYLFALVLQKFGSKKILLPVSLLLLCPTSLFLSPFRFENLLLVFVLLGYIAHLNNRPLLSSFIWGIGFNVKWFPAFIVLARDYKRWREGESLSKITSSILVFFVTVLAPNLLCAAVSYIKLGNINNIIAPMLFHIHRPLYWDTVLGVLTLWWGELSFEHMFDKFSLLLMIFAVFWRSKQSLNVKIILVCVGMLLINRVYSTQFHLWFYPFLLLIAFTTPSAFMTRRLVLFVVALDVLNITVYPFGMSNMLKEIDYFGANRATLYGGLWTFIFSAAVVLRSLILLLCGIFLIRASQKNYLK